MTTDVRTDAIVEGVLKGLKTFPRGKSSKAALEVAARLWVDRGLDLDDFVECAKAQYKAASGQ